MGASCGASALHTVPGAHGLATARDAGILLISASSSSAVKGILSVDKAS